MNWIASVLHTKIMFEDFINKSSDGKEQRVIFSNYIFDKLHDGIDSKQLDDRQLKIINESPIDRYKQSVDFVLDNESLEICKGNRELSESITDNFLEFVSNTQRKINSIGNHFQEEENILNDFKNITNDLFKDKWESVKELINKEYKSTEINIKFYDKEFSKSLNANETENNSFEIIKNNFVKKWEKELHHKKIKYEIKLIEQERIQFLKELYENIEEFKKMMELFGEEMSGALGRLWSMGRGKWSKMNFDAIRIYSEKLKNDKSLMELAEMLGRCQNGDTELIDEEFINTKKRPEWVPEISTKSDLIGIKESNDLSSVLFSEIALLSDKSLESVFIKKFTDKKLQTFEYEGRTKIYVDEEFKDFRKKEIESEKGPFILCIDTSGSMNGSPEEVAKTLVFAMTKIAIRDKRKCFLISFSTDIETLNLTNPDEAMIELIPFLSHSFDGGTDAEPALIEALRMLKNKDYKKADVIMVSDFVMPSFSSGLSMAIKNAKKNKTKFHSLVIDNSHNSKVISEFDTNWIYNPGASNTITLLKNK